VNAEFIARPVFKIFVKVGRRVGKSTEHDNLAVLFAVVVGAWMADFFLDDGLELDQFGIAVRRNFLGHAVQQGKPLFVRFQVFEPVVNPQVRHLKLEGFPYLEQVGNLIIFVCVFSE